MYANLPLAPTGSTGTGTGSSVQVPGSTYEALAFQLVVEAVGSSPTMTYKFQGSPDSTNWYDIGYVTDVSDTISTSTRVRTSVGADISFLSNPLARRYSFFRVVVSANTNVTYRAEAFQIGLG